MTVAMATAAEMVTAMAVTTTAAAAMAAAMATVITTLMATTMATAMAAATMVTTMWQQRRCRHADHDYNNMMTGRRSAAWGVGGPIFEGKGT